MKTVVVNKRYEICDVYVGRGSPWGNPYSHLPQDKSRFPVFLVATRVEAIAKYREWIKTQPQLLAALPTLRGKILGCWCVPLACHADVLAELADAL